MKAILINLLIFAALTLLCTYLLPWYILYFLIAGYSFFDKENSWSLLLPALVAPTLTWMFLTYTGDSSSDHVVAKVLSDMLGNIDPNLTYLLSGLVIGILGLLGAATGILWRKK